MSASLSRCIAAVRAATLSSTPFRAALRRSEASVRAAIYGGGGGGGGGAHVVMSSCEGEMPFRAALAAIRGIHGTLFTPHTLPHLHLRLLDAQLRRRKVLKGDPRLAQLLGTFLALQQGGREEMVLGRGTTDPKMPAGCGDGGRAKERVGVTDRAMEGWGLPPLPTPPPGVPAVPPASTPRLPQSPSPPSPPTHTSRASLATCLAFSRSSSGLQRERGGMGGTQGRGVGRGHREGGKHGLQPSREGGEERGGQMGGEELGPAEPGTGVWGDHPQMQAAPPLCPLHPSSTHTPSSPPTLHPPPPATPTPPLHRVPLPHLHLQALLLQPQQRLQLLAPDRGGGSMMSVGGGGGFFSLSSVCSSWRLGWTG